MSLPPAGCRTDDPSRAVRSMWRTWLGSRLRAIVVMLELMAGWLVPGFFGDESPPASKLQILRSHLVPECAPS